MADHTTPARAIQTDSPADTPIFRYASLGYESRAIVENRTKEIHAVRVAWCQATAQSAIDIGLALLSVEANLPHGQWLPWLSTEFDWTDRTARRLMAIARDAGKSDTVSDLEVVALSALTDASAPNEVIEAEQSPILISGPTSASRERQEPRAVVAVTRRTAPPVTPAEAACLCREELAQLEAEGPAREAREHAARQADRLAQYADHLRLGLLQAAHVEDRSAVISITERHLEEARRQTCREDAKR